MKALVLKEIRQGRGLLVFAAVLGLLVPAVYAALMRFQAVYDAGFEPMMTSYIMGLVAAALLPFLAVFAAGGVFSGEWHRGTLPALLALPLSRKRIWLAMALGAVALTAAASIVLIVLVRLLLPNGFLAAALMAHLPDAICLTVFVLSAGLFASSLTRSVAAGITTTIFIVGLLLAGVITLTLYLGAWLLGLPILDCALWCLFISPALLLGSLAAVTKGELLSGFRKWLFALPVMLLALAVTVVVVCLIARTSAPYHRAAVTFISAKPMQAGDKALQLTVGSRDLRVSQARIDLMTLNPLDYGTSEQNPVAYLRKTIDLPTAWYVVSFDLKTGRERQTARVPIRMWWSSDVISAVSVDGRIIATLSQKTGLTWGLDERSNPDGTKRMELRIYDTQQKKELYRGQPESLKNPGGKLLRWSPSGHYLAVIDYSGTKLVANILRPDGTKVAETPIRFASLCWSPTEEVLYGLDNKGALCRIQPDGSSAVVWSPPVSGPMIDRWLQQESISSDGTKLVMSETLTEETLQMEMGRGYAKTASLRLVDLRTGNSHIIAHEIGERLQWRKIIWSADGKTLYALLTAIDKEAFRQHRGLYHAQLYRWLEGDDRMTPLGQEFTGTIFALFARPEGGVVLVSWSAPWVAAEEVTPYPDYQSFKEQTWLIDDRGQRRQFHLPGSDQEKVEPRHILGFDPRGRLLYLQATTEEFLPGVPRTNRLEAMDLETGKTERVYP
jgi:ABC-type transport system involved in multi-copper enzyme maturation permease subunit